MCLLYLMWLLCQLFLERVRVRTSFEIFTPVKRSVLTFFFSFSAEKTAELKAASWVMETFNTVTSFHVGSRLTVLNETSTHRHCRRLARLRHSLTATANVIGSVFSSWKLYGLCKNSLSLPAHCNITQYIALMFYWPTGVLVTYYRDMQKPRDTAWHVPMAAARFLFKFPTIFPSCFRI